MILFRKLLLLLFVFSIVSSSSAQNINWMMGTWKGVNSSKRNPSTRLINITSVNANDFVGTRSIEIDGRVHMQIVTQISGHINKDTFYIKDGAIITKKEPPHTVWVDCSQCIPSNKVIINGDSLLLTSSVINCDPSCNGIFSYYKLIPEFDTATQRVVINMFGTPQQIIAFNEKSLIPQPLASSDPDAIKQNASKVIAPTAKEKKQYDDSVKLAGIATRKREQQMLDSLKTAVEISKRRRQEIDDSLQKVALIKKQRQQQIDDSLQNVANIAKQKRQQEIDDSLKNAALIAKQEQQEYDDSVKVAKKRQQQIQDSLQTVAALEKKRQQQIADSLQTVANIAKQKRQQEIDDSLKNAALIAKQKQQQYDDSVKVAKKRQQEIQDSLQTVAALEKKRQQQIADSLQTVANIAKQKRQQEIADSLKFAKQQQQHIQDSLQKAAVIAKKRQQQIADSLQTVANIAKQKRQQQIADSIKNAALIAKQKQQHYDDSIKVAQKRQQEIADSLQTIANRNKIRQQEIDDSIKIAAGKKQIIDTAKTTVAKAQDKTKALTQRDNILLQTYHIKKPDILIELFDNAEIDGDRVSVYHNNQPIVSNQMLTHDPIIYKVHADSANRTHEFILVAENLGTIPPNTALMRVTADGQVYKLSVKTDLKTNAKIVFYYDGD
ncbi:MAG TPA: hypothetical protein VHB70_11160 [Parafilimonas sp.]|nr:hypothetical protein [Parafilimonas sp.]